MSAKQLYLVGKVAEFCSLFHAPSLPSGLLNYESVNTKIKPEGTGERRGGCAFHQPRPQGAFPWLWRWGAPPPKPGGSLGAGNILRNRKRGSQQGGSFDS